MPDQTRAARISTIWNSDNATADAANAKRKETNGPVPVLLSRKKILWFEFCNIIKYVGIFQQYPGTHLDLRICVGVVIVE